MNLLVLLDYEFKRISSGLEQSLNPLTLCNLLSERHYLSLLCYM